MHSYSIPLQFKFCTQKNKEECLVFLKLGHNISMFHERRLRAWLGLIAVTLVVAGIAIGSGANQRLQWALQDGLANALRSNAQPHPKVKLILIDDASVNHLSDVVGRYPWPRGIYGPIIEFLNEGGAQHIIFDILFSEQESSMSSQQTFVEAIRNANNVSAVGLITADIPLSNSPPPFLAKSIINVDQVPVITQDYQTLYHPIPAIAEHLRPYLSPMRLRITMAFTVGYHCICRIKTNG